MPTTTLDGITTNFEVVGSGPPLLMFSPGGFDATMAKWSTQGIYGKIKPLDHLSNRYSCIIFDRRESGSSGGRVERVTWGHYVAQAKGLLDHLGFERAHLMGGCMGCSVVLAFAVAHPEMVLSMVLFWPVGGARYRIRTHARFAQHLAYVRENGLDQVAELVASHDRGFGKDPRIGPWGSVLRHDDAFEKQYRSLDPERYELIVSGMARNLLDRDTAPGAEPEDLLALDIPSLIVPGQDETHATSAARYLEECLSGSQYWDVSVDGQTEEEASARILEFLDSVASEPAR
jgi:pimeloyl-ACP methyl ester carboxylesterase